MSKFNDEIMAILFKVGEDKIKAPEKLALKMSKREMRLCPHCKEGFMVLKSSTKKFCSTKHRQAYVPFTEPIGRLTVLRNMGHKDGTGYMYECKCECGRKTMVAGRYLKTKRTVSCGCRREEYYKNEVGRNKTNIPYAKGATGRYNTWQRMNVLGWYAKDAMDTPLLLPPEPNTLEKYKDQ